MAPSLQRIKHLLFADDCLLFIKAGLFHTRNLRQLLSWYEMVAGRNVNIEKSEFTYSPNLDEYMVAILASSIGMNPVEVHSKYLGSPMMVEQNRSEIFRNIEEKMVRRVQDWKNRLPSWAGRETLVKACLQSIPLYSMGCFRLPRGLCNWSTDMGIIFWWSGDKKKGQFIGTCALGAL